MTTDYMSTHFKNIVGKLEIIWDTHFPQFSSMFSTEYAVVEWLAAGISKPGAPGSIPQSRHYGHGGVPLGNAHFLA